MKPTKVQTAIIAVFVAATILVSSTTTTPTGQKVYDPVKTEQVKAVATAVITSGVRRAIQHNADRAMDISRYFRAVGGIFCRMQETKQFEPSWLIDEANKIVPLKQTDYATDVMNAAVALYRINYAARFTAELSPEKWPANVAEVLCQSIDSGLKQAGQPGVKP